VSFRVPHVDDDPLMWDVVVLSLGLDSALTRRPLDELTEQILLREISGRPGAAACFH
jgi:hypothetical protein